MSGCGRVNPRDVFLMMPYRDRVRLHVGVLAGLEDLLDQGLQEIVQELALLGATVAVPAMRGARQ